MQAYNHVVVIGIDGAGAFIKDADTPHFDRIFDGGAVTYEALSSNPTISTECWGSMLLGVGPEVHKLTDSIVSAVHYPPDSPFPSLFRRIREKMPEAELGSFCQWNHINHGIVEENLSVSKATGADTELTSIICGYIQEKKPTFLFAHLSVDGAGHKYGYGTPKHLQRIHEVDELVDDIYNAIKDAGMLGDTLILVISDHGGTPFDGKGGAHGGWSDAEKLVTFAASGRTVKSGRIDAMNIRDLSAIVLYALGLDVPTLNEEGWTSQVPEGLFDDAALPSYRDISHLTGAKPKGS